MSAVPPNLCMCLGTARVPSPTDPDCCATCGWLRIDGVDLGCAATALRDCAAELRADAARRDRDGDLMSTEDADSLRERADTYARVARWLDDL